MGRPAQIRASLRLTRWLQDRYGVRRRDVIGHAESLSSPFHHERVARLRTQTHGDMRAPRCAATGRGCDESSSSATARRSGAATCATPAAPTSRSPRRARPQARSRRPPPRRPRVRARAHQPAAARARDRRLAGLGDRAEPDPDLTSGTTASSRASPPRRSATSARAGTSGATTCPAARRSTQVGARADRVIARALAADGDASSSPTATCCASLGARWIEHRPGGRRPPRARHRRALQLGFERERRVIKGWNS